MCDTEAGSVQGEITAHSLETLGAASVGVRRRPAVGVFNIYIYIYIYMLINDG